MTKHYRIEFNKHCLKDLKKIPPPFRKNIENKITALSHEPRPEGCKKLQGSEKTLLYRIRCGEYRVVYTIHDKMLVVLVIQIGHRGEIYRER